VWRSERDLRGKIERFGLFLLEEKRLLGMVSLQMHAVTKCSFKFTEISGIAFGVGEQHSKVELQMGRQLSV